MEVIAEWIFLSLLLGICLWSWLVLMTIWNSLKAGQPGASRYGKPSEPIERHQMDEMDGATRYARQQVDEIMARYRYCIDQVVAGNQPYPPATSEVLFYAEDEFNPDKEIYYVRS